jgi:hypothetical protein
MLFLHCFQHSSSLFFLIAGCRSWHFLESRRAWSPDAVYTHTHSQRLAVAGALLPPPPTHTQQWNQYLIPIPIPVCAAPVQGLAGPSRLILLSFPVPAWRRDLPDRHGFYLIPCVLLQVRWMHRPCVCGGEGRGSGLWQVTAEYGRKRLPAY